MNEATIVILTAMNLEYSAVRALLSDVTSHRHPKGTLFEIGHLNGCRVALALTDKGNQPAAVLTERAIAEFDPVAVLFVGVAGALQPHLALGDVVVATWVYAYHGATSEDGGLTSRPRSWELSHRAHQIAAHVDRTGSWTRMLPDGSSSPRIHFGPIAAGEIAHYSAVSDARQWLREHYSDALAVEMEAAGVTQAGHLNDALPTIMVRGISDYADSGKSATDDAGWQPRAVANAAAFATALAVILAEELGKGNSSSAPSHATGAGNGGPFNLAMPGAHVGVQGGSVTVHGGIHLGGPDSGSGSVALAGGSAIRRGWRRRALIRVREVFRGITDLAAGVATIMTAVRSVT
jgi:adenosylhomocysteine nucleosidase